MGRCSQLAIVSSLSARNKGLGAYTSVWPGGGPGDSACDSGMSGVAFVSPSHTKPQATGVVHGKKESAVINRWWHLGAPLSKLRDPCATAEVFMADVGWRAVLTHGPEGEDETLC